MLSNEDEYQFQLSGESAELRACQQSGMGNRIECISLQCCQADWWLWWQCLPSTAARQTGDAGDNVHKDAHAVTSGDSWSQEAVQSWLLACSTFWRAMSTKEALCLLPSTPDSLDGQLCTCFPSSRCPSTNSWPPNSYLIFKSLHIVSLHYQNSGCCVCSFNPCLPALLKQGQTVFLINPGWVSIFCIISDVLSIIMNDSGSMYFMPR